MLGFLIGLFIIGISAAVDSPDGDPVLRMDSRVYKRCLEEKNNEVLKFDVLPIYGWDNLRNKYGGMVIEPRYDSCKLDRKFLIPDDVYLISQRRSRIQQFAELINHWQNYTSMTSKSINIEAGLKFGGVGISGKYSDDYKSAKSKQINRKSEVTRIQIRYIRYTAKLQHGAPLHPSFKRALLKIAKLIQLNYTVEATYWSELLVRDFGTHFVNSITAGAALVQEDFVSRQFMAQNKNNEKSILASASFNFFKIVHASFSRSSTVSSSFKTSYEKSITSSQIMAYGGSVYTFQNYSINKWAEKLDQNLVAMDRAGEPLHLLITHENLPEIPTFLAHQVREHVYDAIWRYYEYNIYRGCMKLDSPKFSYIANVDDDSCEPVSSNLTFGGVYQMCTMIQSQAGNLCGGLSQANPKTGKYSCPANYQALKLYTENYKRSFPYRNCKKCGWWGRCCTSGTKRSYATLTVYWCVALKPVPRNSGYLFGGVYSSRVDNLVTMDNSCPDTYTSRMIGSDLYVCLSDDFELGSRLSLPFGGFFSCNSGNPLANKADTKPNAQGPKGCPKGSSQHLAIISQECSVYYCVASGAFSVNGPAPIQRPPFTEEPKYVPENEQFVFYDLHKSRWEMARDEAAMEKMQPKTSKMISLSSSTIPTVDLMMTIFTASIAIVNSVGCLKFPFLSQM